MPSPQALSTILKHRHEDKRSNHGRQLPTLTQIHILRRLMKGEKLIVGAEGPARFSGGGQCLWCSVSSLSTNGYLAILGEIPQNDAQTSRKGVYGIREITFPDYDPQSREPSPSYRHVPTGRRVLPGAIGKDRRTGLWVPVPLDYIWEVNGLDRTRPDWLNSHPILRHTIHNPDPRACKLGPIFRPAK